MASAKNIKAVFQVQQCLLKKQLCKILNKFLFLFLSINKFIESIKYPILKSKKS